MRVRQREQAYSIVQLKEYLPEYDSRLVYIQKRTQMRPEAQPLPDRHRDAATSATAAISRSTPASSPRPPPRRRRRRPSSSTSCSSSRTGWRRCQAPRPRAGAALAGPLRPDPGPDGRLPGQGLRVPGPHEADHGEAPTPEQAADPRPGDHVRGRPRPAAAGAQGRDRQEIRRGPAGCSRTSSPSTPRPPGPTSPRTPSTAASASSSTSGTTTPSTPTAPSSCRSIERCDGTRRDPPSGRGGSIVERPPGLTHPGHHCSPPRGWGRRRQAASQTNCTNSRRELPARIRGIRRPSFPRSSVGRPSRTLPRPRFDGRRERRIGT